MDEKNEKQLKVPAISAHKVLTYFSYKTLDFDGEYYRSHNSAVYDEKFYQYLEKIGKEKVYFYLEKLKEIYDIDLPREEHDDETLKRADRLAREYLDTYRVYLESSTEDLDIYGPKINIYDQILSPRNLFLEFPEMLSDSPKGRRSFMEQLEELPKNLFEGDEIVDGPSNLYYQYYHMISNQHHKLPIIADQCAMASIVFFTSLNNKSKSKDYYNGYGPIDVSLGSRVIKELAVAGANLQGVKGILLQTARLYEERVERLSKEDGPDDELAVRYKDQIKDVLQAFIMLDKYIKDSPYEEIQDLYVQRDKTRVFNERYKIERSIEKKMKEVGPQNFIEYIKSKQNALTLEAKMFKTDHREALKELKIVKYEAERKYEDRGQEGL